MKNQTQALEHASIRQYCKATRLPTVGANFHSLAEQAVKENHSHTRYLEALLSIECEERDRHAIDNRIRDAHLPRLKTLEEFAVCAWLLAGRSGASASRRRRLWSTSWWKPSRTTRFAS